MKHSSHITEYGIFWKGVLFSDGHMSKWSATYELDHRTSAGGDWAHLDRSDFTVSKV